jgi:hypothetical protein
MPDNCEDSVGPYASFQPVRRLLPVYPDERTCSESVGMSNVHNFRHREARAALPERDKS